MKPGYLGNLIIVKRMRGKYRNEDISAFEIESWDSE